MIRLTLEMPWGWTFAMGLGRAVEDAEELSEAAASDSTHGDYTLATGPYSTDFRHEEPWYEPEDRFGFH